jgi:tryptophanyl-tRNA synthetase
LALDTHFLQTFAKIIDMKRSITGIRATGDIHLGNYFAAIKPMVDLQDTYESFIFVADVHALNTVTDPKKIRANILQTVKAYLAAGINPERTVLFQMSRLPHGDLAMMIGAQTGLGFLQRAHAYKDAEAKGESVNFGVFSYPVLMAADILLYQAEIVPVGKDQHQHLEMTREIAEKFNHLYGKTFAMPQTFEHDVPTIPGLDGRKMSKSYGNVIGIFEEPEEIRKKVMKIITDSKRPEEPKDPDTCTVFAIYKLVSSPEATEAMRKRYVEGGISYKEAKEALADALLAYLKPLQEREAALSDEEVIAILEDGAKRAQVIADQTIKLVRERVGVAL